jgi:3-dehydroquinate synthase
MAVRIRVNVPDSTPYDIIIERGLLKNLHERADEFNLSESVVIATNTHLDDLYRDKLTRWLPDAKLALMQDGEQYKNLDTVRGFYDRLLDIGADRNTTLLAFGGGVLGDTAGFVAATYMRGIPLVQAPTSLLAMVDSSVGGKVGVDVPQGKNLVGAFKQPQVVLIDPAVLQTLDSEQWRCGMAEIIKHGLLADEQLLNRDLWQPDRAEDLIERAVRVKVNVVQQDPYEHGIRAHLNLGHTFGHAIEKVTQYAWLHGDAVGVGLLAAAKLSYRLGLCEADLIDTIDALLADAGLPRSTGNLNPDSLYEAMKTDKKWKHGVSRFILLEGMNQATIVEDVPREDVIAVLSEMAD